MLNLKSLFALILIGFLFVGCCPPQERMPEKQKTSGQQKQTPKKQTQKKQTTRHTESAFGVENDIDQQELKHLGSWRGKRYFAKLKVKTSRVSLDLMEHMKDGLNSFEFYVPIDSIAYHEMKVGQNLKSDFRGGSFIVGGSISRTKIIVMALVKR